MGSSSMGGNVSSLSLRTWTLVLGIGGIVTWLLWFGTNHGLFFRSSGTWSLQFALYYLLMAAGTASVTAFVCILSLRRMWSPLNVVVACIGCGMALAAAWVVK